MSSTEIEIVDLENATSEQKAILMLMERTSKLEERLETLFVKPKVVCVESEALRARVFRRREQIRHEDLAAERASLPEELRDSGVVDDDEIKWLADVDRALRRGATGEVLFNVIFGAFTWTRGFASKEAVAWLEKATAPYLDMWSV